MTFILTEEQRAVLSHPLDQHGRVLAGPGTGKSATAVLLVSKLLENPECLPKIKFLTFTRAATAELAEKIEVAGSTVERPSTFHSFAIAILLRNPGCTSFPTPLRIPSKVEERILVAHLAQLMGVTPTKIKLLLSEMAAKWESLTEHPLPEITPEERSRFTGLLQRHKKLLGYTLLTELPELFRAALRDHDDLEGLDYNLIIVDEYQDLNAADLDVLRRLAAQHISILAIGDDDQSIYSFRHAAPEGIERFLSDYSTTYDYPLTMCHRCSSSMITWAQHVIHGDTTRRSLKQLRLPGGAPVGVSKLLKFRSYQAEAKGVRDIVKWLHNVKSVPYSQILILTRTDNNGTFTQPIKEKLEEANIPVSNPEQIKAILHAENNRYLISVLRLLSQNDDSLAWWSILADTDQVGSTFIDYLYNHADSESLLFGEIVLREGSSAFSSAPSRGRANAVTAFTGLMEIKNRFDTEDISTPRAWGTWIIENIAVGNLPTCSDELKSLFLKIDEAIEEDSTLDRFLSQLHPLGKDILTAQSEGVRFMSMTSSKGLTVQATIVVGVENELIPRENCDISEERRLLYVAMTRAKEYLYLTWVNRRLGASARAGRVNVGNRRQPTDFLAHGPVESEDGETYISSLLFT